MESPFGSLKVEHVHLASYRTPAEARASMGRIAMPAAA